MNSKFKIGDKIIVSELKSICYGDFGEIYKIVYDAINPDDNHIFCYWNGSSRRGGYIVERNLSLLFKIDTSELEEMI